jgi:hypothetical protein
MLTNEQLAELIGTIRDGHCRSYVDAAKVLAEEFLPVLRARVETPEDLAVQYQHMFVNLTNTQARCTALIQENREQANQILHLLSSIAPLGASEVVKEIWQVAQSLSLTNHHEVSLRIKALCAKFHASMGDKAFSGESAL